MYFAAGILILVCSPLVLAQLLANTPTNPEVRPQALLDNLSQRGLLSRVTDPCSGINCGPGRACAPVTMGYSSVQTYQCRSVQPQPGVPQPVQPTGPIQPIALQPVPKCADTIAIKVPALVQTGVRPQGSAPRQGAAAAPSCRVDCVDNAGCAQNGPGYTCCMRGCDRVCYLPRITSVDYTNY